MNLTNFVNIKLQKHKLKKEEYEKNVYKKYH